MIGRGWRRRRTTDSAARDLYDAIVERARQPVFYADLGVPDTLDGRFDLVLLHAFLVLRRLSHEGAMGAASEEDRSDAQAVGQALYDTMFADMDESLREIGVGDLSIGKKIRAMTEAFRGRVGAYDAALDAAGAPALADTLRRNLYGTTAPSPAQLSGMAGYVAGAGAALAALPDAEVIGGRVGFGPLPAAV